jgi:hypothetical protein
MGQGCQMAYFQTVNPDLGKLRVVLQLKMSVYYMAIGSICGYLVYFVAIWYILGLFGVFSRFGRLYQEKSGNPGMGPFEKSFRK